MKNYHNCQYHCNGKEECKIPSGQKDLLILIPAHNEEGQIKTCITDLKHLKIPKGFTSKIYVIIDRCTDKTKDISEELGVTIIEKNFRGDWTTASAECCAFGIEKIKFGDYILKCDADIKEIPQDTFLILRSHLIGNVKKVSPKVRTRSGKWWLDILFWFADINRKITPLGAEARGGIYLFKRATIKEVGGLDKHKPFDTGFNMKIKAKGWSAKKIKDITVTEKRNFTLKRLIIHQIQTGKTRRKLGIPFWRTLLHSIFRGRIFVIYGYVKERENKNE